MPNMTQQTFNATGKRIAGQDSAPVESALMDVGQVAKLLHCSVRHVYRLAEAGQMPRPVKLGALVRWSRTTIEHWIAGGCPDCPALKGGLD